MALQPYEIRLENVRLAFPRLWTPEPFRGGDDPTPYYSATFILGPDHPQLKTLKALMDTLAKDKWGVRGPTVLKTAEAKGKVFLRDGETKSEYEGFEGNWYVSARSKVRPTIVDGSRNPIAESDGILFSGCYVNAIISTFAYIKGNNGLGAGLKGVQFRNIGDAFSGGAKAADTDEFDEIGVPDSDDDLAA